MPGNISYIKHEYINIGNTNHSVHTCFSSSIEKRVKWKSRYNTEGKWEGRERERRKRGHRQITCRSNFREITKQWLGKREREKGEEREEMRLNEKKN